MTEKDSRLAQAVRQSMPETVAMPSFAATWQAAERRAARRRRRLQMAAAAAVAVIGLVVVADLARPPDGSPEYIEVAELMNTTSWSAPSDALLPDRRIDIYKEIPALMESTETDGGALL
jgi:hypothetical protein